MPARPGMGLAVPKMRAKFKGEANLVVILNPQFLEALSLNLNLQSFKNIILIIIIIIYYNKLILRPHLV